MKMRFLVLYSIVALSLLGNAVQFFISYDQNRVISVPDGDTLQLKDGRRVRLRSIDAPEQGRCMATEARNLLESTALHKHLRFNDTLTDSFGRTLAVAFIGKITLNEMMLQKGLARHFSSGTNYDNLLSNISNDAKKSGVGIFSSTCRSSTPKNNCKVKGNLRSSEKTYYLPSCRDYDAVIVDEAYGDIWFCSEKEAIGAGFTKSKRCF